jgi:hypothetical protein
VQNLSHLAEGSLTMNSSMAAGNTVSVNPPFSPIGSESEAYADIELHSEPEPDLGPNNDRQLKTTGDSAGEFSVTPCEWKKVP